MYLFLISLPASIIATHTNDEYNTSDRQLLFTVINFYKCTLRMYVYDLLVSSNIF